jgi:hypothetical protein
VAVWLGVISHWVTARVVRVVARGRAWWFFGCPRWGKVGRAWWGEGPGITSPSDELGI